MRVLVFFFWPGDDNGNSRLIYSHRLYVMEFDFKRYIGENRNDLTFKNYFLFIYIFMNAYFHKLVWRSSLLFCIDIEQL